MTRDELSTIRQLKDQLGKSYPTLQKYSTDKSWPAELCIKVEELTDGKIRAVNMRPDIFIPTHDQHHMALKALESFNDDFDHVAQHLFILILNYLEQQTPSLYNDVIASLSDKEGGEEFMRTRKAHQDDGSY